MGIVIYGLADPNSRELRYIGKTSKSLKQRLNGHIRDNSKCHRVNWIKGLMKIGLMPEIFVIEETTEDYWEREERWFINYFRAIGCNLTNGTDGGEGSYGFKHNQEAKDKLRQVRLGKIPSEETRRKMSASQLGRKHSDETKRKISEANSGRKLSEETIERIIVRNKERKHSESAKRKISAANKGKVRTAETKERMSEAQRGKKHSEETKKKISEAAIGRKGSVPSEETRRKIGASKLGKPRSEETKRKISETKRNQEQRPRDPKTGRYLKNK